MQYDDPYMVNCYKSNSTHREKVCSTEREKKCKTVFEKVHLVSFEKANLSFGLLISDIGNVIDSRRCSENVNFG